MRCVQVHGNVSRSQADGYKAPYKTTAADRKTRMDKRAQRGYIHALQGTTEIAWTRLGEWRDPQGRGLVTPRRGNERGGEVGHVTPHHDGEQRQGPRAHVGLKGTGNGRVSARLKTVPMGTTHTASDNNAVA